PVPSAGPGSSRTASPTPPPVGPLQRGECSEELRRQRDLLHAPGGGRKRRPGRRLPPVRRVQPVDRPGGGSSAGRLHILRHGLHGHRRARRRPVRLGGGSCPRPGPSLAPGFVPPCPPRRPLPPGGPPTSTFAT